MGARVSHRLAALLVGALVGSFAVGASADDAPAAPPPVVPAPTAASVPPAAAPAPTAVAPVPTAVAPAPTVAAPVPTAVAPSSSVLRVAVDGRVVDVALGCERRAFLRVGDRAYVACGDDGVVVVDLVGEPRVRARIATSGEAVGLFVRNGRVWVEQRRVEAMPIGSERGLADTAPKAEVASPREPLPADEPAAPSSVSPSSPPSIVAPKRLGGLFELGLGSRFFLTVGDLGFGALAHAYAVRRFEAPVALRFDALPLAGATGKAGAVGAATATVLVSVDTHVFELGVGIGGGTLPRTLRYTSTTDGRFVPIGGAGGSVSVPTLVRFGARDGLSLVARTSLMVLNDEFELGAIDIVGQVPVSDRVALLFTGEGGNIGTASGGMGLRYRATEARGRGAVFVTGNAGYALVEGATECRQDTTVGGGFPICTRPQYSGPSLGVAVELRL